MQLQFTGLTRSRLTRFGRGFTEAGSARSGQLMTLILHDDDDPPVPVINAQTMPSPMGAARFQ
jgi:hypothetical protein